MQKLRQYMMGSWDEIVFPRVYGIEDGRIVCGINAGDLAILDELVSELRAPLLLLYVLHTRRDAGQVGRYQSPPISQAEMSAFLTRFGDYLLQDSRFDFWVHSPEDEATIVLDRHNLLFCYSKQEPFEQCLKRLSFVRGELPALGPHQHAYLPAFDKDAQSLLTRYEWTFTPLRPEDEQ